MSTHCAFVMMLVGLAAALPLEWKEISFQGSTQPPALIGSCFAYNKDLHRILVFGGRVGETCYNSLWEINLDTMIWKEHNVTSSLIPSSRHSCAAAYSSFGNNKGALVIGVGLDQNNEYLGDVYFIEFENGNPQGEWQFIQGSPFTNYPRDGLASGTCDGVLWISHGSQLDDDTLQIRLPTFSGDKGRWRNDCCDGKGYAGRPVARRGASGTMLCGEDAKHFVMFGGCALNGFCPRHDTQVTFDGQWHPMPGGGDKPHPQGAVSTSRLVPFGDKGDAALLLGNSKEMAVVRPEEHWAFVWEGVELDGVSVVLPVVVHVPHETPSYIFVWGAEEGSASKGYRLEGVSYTVRAFPASTGYKLYIAAYVLLGTVVAVSMLVIQCLIHRPVDGKIHNWLLRRHLTKIPKKAWLRLVLFFSSLTHGQVLLLFGVVLSTVLFVLGNYLMLQNKAWDLNAIGRTFGRTTVVAYGLVLLPVSRNSIFAPLLGTSFERSIRFHRWLGRTILIFGWMHGISMALGNGYGVLDARVTPNTPPIFGFLGMVTGFVAGAAGFFRRQYFEWFFYTHPLAFVGMIGACFHVPHILPYFVAPGAGLWVIDRFVRIIKGKRKSAVESIAVGGGIVRLDIITKGLLWRPGQFSFIRIPRLSRLQWHPISLCYGTVDTASVEKYDQGGYVLRYMHFNCISHSEHFSIYIKGVGTSSSWSHRLQLLALEEGATELEMVKSTRQVSSESSSKTLPNLAIEVEAPYGQLGFDLAKNPSMVCVAGGIGITSIIPLCISLARLRHAQQEEDKAGMLVLYWLVQRKDETELFLGLLEEMMQLHGQFRVILFETRSDMPSEEDKEPRESVEHVVSCHMRPCLRTIVKRGIEITQSSIVVGSGPPRLMDDLQRVCKGFKDGELFFHAMNYLL